MKAVLAWPDGAIQVLRFDDARWLDTGVFVDAHGAVTTGAEATNRGLREPAGYVAFPLLELSQGDIEVAGRRVEVVDLVAAPLRLVAAEAARLAGGMPADVTVAVPAGWGPQRRTRLRAALYRAGLGEPALMEGPVAVGWYLLEGGVSMPVGSCLLVCDFGIGFDATVLRRTASDFEVLATLHEPQAAGPAVDAALAAHVAAVPPGPPGQRSAPTAAAVAQARLAKETLSTTMSVLCRSTPDAMPAVLGVEQFHRAARPAMTAAATTAHRAVQAADTTVEALRWVVCVGGGARMPVVVDPLQAELGVRPFMAADPDLAGAYGTLRTATAATAGAEPLDAANPATPTRLESMQDAAVLALPMLTSVVLLGQFLAGAQRYGPRHSIVPGTVVAHWGGLAVSSATAVLAAVAWVVQYTAARQSVHQADGPEPRRWLRHRSLAAALGAGAVLGLGVAALYPMIAAGYLDVPAAPFLRWSVLAVLPLVAAVIILAGVMVWRPEPPGQPWLSWLRFPLPTIALAGLGELLIGYDVSGSPSILNLVWWWAERWSAQWWPPSGALQVISFGGRVGAACLGIGITLLLVRRPLHRLLIGPALAGLVAATLTVGTTGMLAAGFVLAAAGWWLWKALYVLLRPVFLGPSTHPPAIPPPNPAHPAPTAARAGDIDGELVPYPHPTTGIRDAG